jgi:transcription-repair coupling factor (superfamily II helicase)
MGEAELEPVMIGFINGEIDILLSTTIIENGIDIPNANTLIVENADRLGLAQLYQLRGRVGRSDRQAYAYFLYEERKELSEGAIHRLQALQEFSTLGSGYSLAFRDLQIRGAGELLGSKQHGAMAAVGYELYTQLINDAVQQLKNAVDGVTPALLPGEAHLEPLPTFDASLTALIPEDYIRDAAQRLYYYQRMMGSKSPAELAEVKAEVEDRYGSLPEPVEAAFRVMRVRMHGRDLGFSKIDGRGGRVVVWFVDKARVPPMAFSILGKRHRECYVTRESFVWPFTGDVLAAAERRVEEFGEAVEEVEGALRDAEA